MLGNVPLRLEFTELVRVELEPDNHFLISERNDGLFSCTQERFITLRGQRIGKKAPNALVLDEQGLEEVLNAFQGVFDYILERRQRARDES